MERDNLIIPNYIYLQKSNKYKCLYFSTITALLFLNSIFIIFNYMYLSNIYSNITGENTTQYLQKIEGILDNICVIFPEVCD